MQIRSGIRSAKNDVVVLLHADSRLMPGAISRMLTALQENDSVVGGCFGAAYDDLRSGFRINRLLPVLSRIWVACLGHFTSKSGRSSSGARQSRILSLQYDYLADVEISLCMKEKGAIVFIPAGVTGTVRRQEPAWKWTDYIKAIYVTMRYLTLRRLGFLGCWKRGLSSCCTHRSGKKAGRLMIAKNVAKLRFFLAADILCIQTPRVKPASGRWINGAGNIAF